MQDLNDKATTHTLTAVEWNEVPSELQNVITAWGQALTSGDLNQLGKGIAAYAAASTFYTGGGTANAHTATKLAGIQAPPDYFDGMIIRFRPTNANTAAATVNVDTLGVKSIVKENGNILSANDIATTRDCICRYDNGAGNFKLMNYTAQESATPRGHLWGMELSNGTDADHDIDVSAGICRNDANSITMQLSASFTKQLDNGGAGNGWVAGDGNEGRPVGVNLAVDTWYHVFVIYEIATGSVDIGFDTDIDAVNLLADSGYDYYRRLGSVLTDGSSNIFAFFQHGDEFQWAVLARDYDETIVDTDSTQVTVSTPLGIKTIAHVSVGLQATADTGIYVTPGDAPVGSTHNISHPCDSIAGVNGTDIEWNHIGVSPLTDISSRIRYELSSSAGSVNVTVLTHGWNDDRGRTA